MRITAPMYQKGRSFVLAGGLVKAYEGDRFVYLHLLCQGFENIGKAMLLAKDYEKYGPLLKSMYGHDLKLLLADLKKLYGSDFLSEQATVEIHELNSFYKQHQLRYGDPMDFSGDYSRLQVNQLHSELAGHLDFLNQTFSEIDNDA